MNILIVSGFLGAGKTTFIQELVRRLDEPAVVLENEFGEVGIDRDLLEGPSLDVNELTSGCICCSMKTDNRESILEIMDNFYPKLREGREGDSHISRVA